MAMDQMDIDDAPSTTVSDSVRGTVTGLVYDPRMRLHGNIYEDEHHPEDPKRISAIYKALLGSSCVKRMVRIPAREATREEVLLVHAKEHWDKIISTVDKSDEQLQRMANGYNSIYLNNESALSARLACGGVIEMCLSVVNGKVNNGFANVRPPGHHAEPGQAMGFCLFNNVAVAARCLRRYHNVERVFILDWDIHHGNGTQKVFYDDPNVVYCSIHRYENARFYPGDEEANYTHVGGNGARGKTINIPWPRKGMTDSDYIYAFNRIVMPIAYEFGPNIVIVSAGFDAARGDPIGENDVTPAGFAHMTSLLKNLSGGKLVLALEGGYNINSISKSALACVKVLLGEDPPDLGPISPSKDCIETVHQVTKIQSQYWKCLAPSNIDEGEEITLTIAKAPGKMVINMTEMLRIIRARGLLTKYSMVPLPISDERLATKFYEHVLCSKKMYEKKVLFLFVHEMPDFRADLKAHTNSVNHSRSYMVDSMVYYIENVVQNPDYGIIDVAIPSGDSRTRSDLVELLVYLWDNHIQIASADRVVLLGASIGCHCLATLINDREQLVMSKVICSILIPGDCPVPAVTKRPTLTSWYYERSFIAIAQNHLHFSKKPNRTSHAFGNIVSAEYLNDLPIQDILVRLQQDIFGYVSNVLAEKSPVNEEERI